MGELRLPERGYSHVEPCYGKRRYLRIKVRQTIADDF